MTQSIILMDTEFTSWEGALESDWGEDWQHREIVQIGALKMNPENFEVLGTFNQLVKPVKNPVLSDFLVSLTGITNEDVQNSGVSFEQSYQDLIDFAGGAPVWCYGWDGTIIAENCAMINRPEWKNALEINNLHHYFQQNGVNTKKINSGKLADFFNVDIEIREHNAMDDVFSIHAALKHLKEQGRDTPFKEKRR